MAVKVAGRARLERYIKSSPWPPEEGTTLHCADEVVDINIHTLKAVPAMVACMSCLRFGVCQV